MMRVKTISNKVLMYFSNQPKNIPKPDPIQFNFKIPNKPNASSKQFDSSNSQVKVVKAKRSTQILKSLKKKQTDQFKSHVQAIYQQQQQQKVKQNLKTQNYHQSQYFKGEHLLQNVPLNPFYQYKLADFQRKLLKQKNKFKDFIGNYTNYEYKAQQKFKIAQLYHEKQQKYQIQQFLRYIDQYPGSPKGPLPEDDMVFFFQYAYKKMPAILAQQIAYKQGLDQKNQKFRSKSQNDVQYYKIPQQTNLSNIVGGVRSLQQPQLKNYHHSNQYDKMSKYPIFKEYQQVPEIPEMQFNDYQQWMRDLSNWQNFRNYYVRKNGEDNVQKQIQYLSQVDIENDPDPQNEYFTPKIAAPSLMRYYQTLPKQLQDHPGLKDIYLGLQFSCPYLSYQQKQQALNLACTKVLPLQKLSLRAMTDFVNDKKKFYITPFISDKIFTINPQFTWDIKQFFDQIKRQQLKGQSMIKQNEGSYPEPPQVHQQWEQGVANLPVDFYDNDDGFWDEIIKQKLARQDEAKPIMKVRKHFLH